MSKYRFVKFKDINNSFDVSKISFVVETDDLHDVLEEFKNFLLACGFQFKGNIDIVDDECEVKHADD